MSKLEDGREVLCTLALPLPLDLASALGEAIGDAAEELGYRDVSLLTDGTNRVVARKAAPESCPSCDWPQGETEPVACPRCGR